MPETNNYSQRYYPKLSEIITIEDLPEFLSFVQDGLNAIFDKIHYKNLQYSKSFRGDAAFYSLDIVTRKPIKLALPFDMALVLNPDMDGDGNISSFPITLEYQWEILAFLKTFSLEGFSFSLEDFYQTGLKIFRLTEDQVLAHTLNYFVEDPLNGGTKYQSVVDEINALYSGQSGYVPIVLPTNEEITVPVVTQLISQHVTDRSVSMVMFVIYILDSDMDVTSQRLREFYNIMVPEGIETYIRKLITPKARATLALSAAIEFPPNILKPVDETGVVIEGQTTKFLFAQALLYADTQAGIGYQLELAGSLVPTFAAIGNTGLILQIVSLKMDLSKESNIPEADLDGRPSDFVGVYARAISVTFPPKWFHDDNEQQGNSTTTLRLGAYDLLIGTGGVSGTIMLESIPIINEGAGFEYYNDKFTFDYPITMFGKDMESDAIIEKTINTYQELKDYLQELNSISNAPYPFKFPLSLKPIGSSTSLVFDNAVAYQYYLAGLKNDILWKRIGSENGFEVGFTSFDITFKQNEVVSSNIAGSLKIDKFKYPEDVPVVGGQPVQIDVTGHLESNGDFLLTASTNPPFPIQFGDVFKFHMKSIELGKEDDDFFIGASCDVEFLGFMGEILEGQTFSISALRIYSNGRIEFKIDGGNLILPKPIKLNLGPVELSVTAVHFGSHEREKDGQIRKYNYFGFDAGVSIGVAGIDARGDGIKFYYTVDDGEGKPHDSYLHIQTIYVDMVIPANSDDPTVMIKGWLSIPAPGEFPEYMGGVSLKVKKPNITGSVDMRLTPKYPAFLIDASIELPNPIALGPVSIYGFRGLLGYRYVAEKEAIGMTSENTWYEYYKTPVKGVNVKKFSRPDKTEHYNFPFSLGVGAIIGDTMAAGNIISANAMLLLSLPSMVMVDARMKILSKRVSFADDPPFFAFFIFGDNSLEFGFGADYKFPENTGDIIKIYAEIQLGFFFNNPSAWYLNIGTQETPISASLLKDLFTLWAYVMLSGKGIQAGARGEFRFERKYGPVYIFVLAYLELGGRISFEKPQMGGYFEAGLTIDINVKIFRLYLAITILLSVESPKPFMIYGAFMVEFRLKLLFFKLKFKAKVEVKWEFNKQVDRTPVNPFTEVIEQEEGLVKGVSMLTNETFDLAKLTLNSSGNVPNTQTVRDQIRQKVVPLDTYIDIKTTKGLLPGSNDASIIGGVSNPPDYYVDLVPPEKVMKGIELRQVRHQYSIEKIEIMAYNGSSWVSYNPYRALYPVEVDPNPVLDQLKSGQWQKKDNQYNAVRMLATTPFSYTEQGEPGWFIPEQYGITASTLFCEGQEVESSISDFLDKPLNTVYYAYSGNFFHSKNASYQLSGEVEYIVNEDGTVTMEGDYATVSNEPNIWGFAKSLEFPNHAPLTIMLPAPSAEVKLKLSTDSTSVTVEFYKPLINDNESQVQYFLFDTQTIIRQNLNQPVSISVDHEDGITKIIIIPEPNQTLQIGSILDRMAVLMNEGYELAMQEGDEITTVEPSDPVEYEELGKQLAIQQKIGCNGVKDEKDEGVCRFYPELIGDFNNKFILPYVYYPENDQPDETELEEIYALFIKGNLSIYISIGQSLQTSGITSSAFVLNTNQYNQLMTELSNYNTQHPNDYAGIISKFELLKSKLQQILDLLSPMRDCEDPILCNLSNYLTYQTFAILTSRPPAMASPFLDAYKEFIKENPSYQYLNGILDRQIDTIETILALGWNVYLEEKDIFDGACREIITILADLGYCNKSRKCSTLFHEISWLTVEDYVYNVNIPGQEAITGDAGLAVQGINDFIQPVWRPDTSYYVKFAFKDDIDNGQANKVFNYAFGFHTAGPLGFFHQDEYSPYGVIPDNELDLYPHTSLRGYIDYNRSYPNADGNLVNAKPLFYDDETTEITIFFRSPYVRKLLEGWEEYGNLDPLGGTMKIIIKDPVEGIDIINPPRLDTTEENIENSEVDIPQTLEEWAEDDNPLIPPVLEQYINMLNNGCTGIITVVKPKSFYRKITPKRLKPQKLYTIQVLNFYWGNNENVDISEITEEMKAQYAREIHKYVFQTSRYKNFAEQVNSYLIAYDDENGDPQTKLAIYDIEKELEANKIQAALDTIKGNSNSLSDAISQQFLDPFDRVMEGLFAFSPLEDSVTTEFNRIIDSNTGKIIALLIRNPEPFNHPKIPLEEIYRKDDPNNPGNTIAGMIEILENGLESIDESYHFLYSKDYAQALLMNDAKWINDSLLDFQFIYKIWDGSVYQSTPYIITGIQINP